MTSSHAKKFNETAEMANCTDFPLIFCGNGPKWTKTIQTRFSLQKKLRYPGKPGLTQAILPHSTQKHQQRVCQRMQSAQNTNILAKTFFFDVLSQNAQSEERYLCHRPIQKILFDAKFTKTKTQ